jgi:hypothetical protein
VSFMLIARCKSFMLSVVMQNVIMLKVVAPLLHRCPLAPKRWHEGDAEYIKAQEITKLFTAVIETVPQ